MKEVDNGHTMLSSTNNTLPLESSWDADVIPDEGEETGIGGSGIACSMEVSPPLEELSSGSAKRTLGCTNFVWAPLCSVGSSKSASKEWKMIGRLTSTRP